MFALLRSNHVWKSIESRLVTATRWRSPSSRIGGVARLGQMAADRKQIVRDSYAAFAAGDRNFFEQRLSDDFLFSAPPDPKLDRDGYFERCWPGAGRGQDFDFVRLIESGDEVVVTYESDVSGGGRGRNTEVITFDDEDKIARTEVYFGWNLK
jgi:ketosteroid isomerase-like protein